MITLTPSQEDALRTCAGILGANIEDLRAEIAFESAWRPDAKNPNGSARGLIQFIDRTSQALGYRDSLHLVTLHPTIESQLLGPALRYLAPWKPFRSLQSLAMAIFAPSMRSAPEDSTFPLAIQRVNPGIRTVKDYMDKVRRVGVA